MNTAKFKRLVENLLKEENIEEAVDTLGIQKSKSEEGNTQITLSVLGGGFDNNQLTLSVEEAKELQKLAKEFAGNRNSKLSKGVNTSDKMSTQSIISIEPDKLNCIISRKEGSVYKGYDKGVEAEAGYLKAQQSIVYQIVDELGKNLEESIEEETVNVVDSIPELQRKLKDLAINLPKIKGIDVAEVKNLSALLDAITAKLGKGSVGVHQKAALDVFNKRTQGLK